MSASKSQSLAVLCSGGLDSAIYLAEALAVHPLVVPMYVRFGLSWEDVECAHLRRFLRAVAAPALRPLVVLQQPVADLYGTHWSLTGQGVPDANSPDEAVFLPGRNVLLLAKAVLWCHLHQIPQLAMAPLMSNPFPDATESFFRAFLAAVNQSVGGSVRLVLPYSGLHKTDVLRRGAKFPLQHTFSCIRPIAGEHCGECNKCAERQKGFHEAGLPDPTPYRRPSCSA